MSLSKDWLGNGRKQATEERFSLRGASDSHVKQQ
jgi:hypothetical protein